ncbi:hypothetical protein CgunFtcFv8_010386 [Champsocephalus gunnari]|uniref:Uncharacterized protein n=1 Tax=Champsocephalus gunnari TaxID=52237 RepID=A0AAN8DTL6_CHAGU|nr:hypothetical protein CgunFtcFv8_010386 [Champsocephalus gunnari]
MWMTNVVALCLLALVASAEDKKLSSHATTLADKTNANLAFSLYNTNGKGERHREHPHLSCAGGLLPGDGGSWWQVFHCLPGQKGPQC